MSWQQQMFFTGLAQARHIRDLRDHSTCPHCHTQWTASRPTEAAFDHDFQGMIFCPDCYQGSRANRNLNTLFLQDGHRVPAKERDR